MRELQEKRLYPAEAGIRCGGRTEDVANVSVKTSRANFYLKLPRITNDDANPSANQVGELLSIQSLVRLTLCISCGPGWRDPGCAVVQINCQPGSSIRPIDQHLCQGRDRTEPSAACAS